MLLGGECVRARVREARFALRSVSINATYGIYFKNNMQHVLFFRRGDLDIFLLVE